MPTRIEIFEKRGGIVMHFVMGRINKRGVVVFDDVAQLGHGLAIVCEFGPITRPKFWPARWIVVKPFA